MATIEPVSGKPGKFKEWPDRYKGGGTGHREGSYMDCHSKCSRHDGLCREYNRDLKIREEKAKLKYPKKGKKPTLLELAGGKPSPSSKRKEENCDGHMKACRTKCEKLPK